MPNPDEALAQLFEPLDVVVVSEYATAEAEDSLSAEELLVAERMVASRRHEFATGRRCARAALRSEISIGRDDRGAPQWPPNISGTITHGGGLCAAAVVNRHAGVIGIDIERESRVTARIQRRIMTRSEISVNAALAPENRLRHAASIFVAKEAFYKAQYQLTQSYLGFQAVSVTFIDDRLTFEANGPSDVSSFIDASHGRVLARDGLVCAGVIIST